MTVTLYFINNQVLNFNCILFYVEDVYCNTATAKKSVHLFSYKGYQELSSMVCIERKADKMRF